MLLGPSAQSQVPRTSSGKLGVPIASESRGHQVRLRCAWGTGLARAGPRAWRASMCRQPAFCPCLTMVTVILALSTSQLQTVGTSANRFPPRRPKLCDHGQLPGQLPAKVLEHSQCRAADPCRVHWYPPPRPAPCRLVWDQCKVILVHWKSQVWI